MLIYQVDIELFSIFKGINKRFVVGIGEMTILIISPFRKIESARGNNCILIILIFEWAKKIISNCNEIPWMCWLRSIHCNEEIKNEIWKNIAFIGSYVLTLPLRFFLCLTFSTRLLCNSRVFFAFTFTRSMIVETVGWLVREMTTWWKTKVAVWKNETGARLDFHL